MKRRIKVYLAVSIWTVFPKFYTLGNEYISIIKKNPLSLFKFSNEKKTDVCRGLDTPPFIRLKLCLRITTIANLIILSIYKDPMYINVVRPGNYFAKVKFV